ncbi:hypothetical protein BGX27_000373, partial [Mortierella sp. AM989]
MAIKIFAPIAAFLFASVSVSAAKCANTCPEEIQTVCGVSYKGNYRTFPNLCIMDFHNCIFPDDDYSIAPVPASFSPDKFYSCEALGHHTEL